MKKLFFLLLTAVCALLYGPPANAWIIYLNPDGHNSAPHIHLYGGSWESNWDNLTMQKADDGRYYYSSELAAAANASCFKTAYDGTAPKNVISHGDKQSGDNVAFVDGNTYTWEDKENGSISNEKWLEFYVDKGDTGWSDVYCYYWSGLSAINNTNPKGINVSGNIYKIVLPTSSIDGMLFHNGSPSGTNQSDNAPSQIFGHLYTLSKRDNTTAEVTDSGEYNGTPQPDVEWTEYTFYFKNTSNGTYSGFSGWTNPRLYIINGSDKIDPSSYASKHNEMNDEGNNVYSLTFKATETPKIIFTNNGWGSEAQTRDIENPENGKMFVITGDYNEGDTKKYTGEWQTYNPVTVTGVELLKNGTAVNGAHTAATYSWNLSGLAGTEKFLVKVNMSDGTAAYYTVNGTSLTSTSADNAGFSIDSKAISATMTVTVEDNAATGYTLNITERDAITGVYLGSTEMEGSGSTYTLNGIENVTTGFTVKVTTTRNADGIEYTVSDGSNLLAGDHPLTAGTAPFTVASTIPTFNATVTVSDDTFAATGIKIADPNAVITAVSIVSHDGSQNYVMTSTDGITWTWHGTVKPFDATDLNLSKDYDKTAAYHIAVTNAGTAQKWYYNDNNEGLSVNTTYNTAGSWKIATGTEFFRFSGADASKDYLVTVTLTDDKKSIKSLKYEAYVAPPTPAASVHMPLTAKDFANGPRYFIVGTRMGDWRLQPEWELTVNGDEATLAGRLMYKGMFGIAKVDSYDDYIYHKYTLYVNIGDAGYWVKNANETIALNSSRSAQAIRYDKAETKGKFTTDNCMVWDSEKKDWTADNVKTSAPALLNKVTVKLNGGVPESVSFDFTTDKAAVAAARTFSLVGENFRYEGDCSAFSDGVARSIDTMTPSQSRAGANSKGWGNGWVLYDDLGAPYVDGYGNVMFCTAYDKTWLASHPVQFYDTEHELNYSSLGTVFVPYQDLDKLNEDPYADLYKMHPQVGDDGKDLVGGKEGSRTSDTRTSPDGKYSYTETMPELWADSGGNAGPRYYNEASNWQCYVVKGMWINGPFKVWEGWGGNLKAEDGVNDNDSESAERWNYENGGHNYAGKDVNITGEDPDKGTVNVYGTYQDVNAANFNIADMTYFTRVILWYDPDKGISNSAIQLISASYGPEIQAFPNTNGKRNTLRYRWRVSTADSSADDYTITGYKIYRYKVVGGKDTDETLVKEVASGYGKKISERKEWLVELDDEKELSAGVYRYVIKATFDLGSGSDVEKEAISNTVTIYESSVPVKLAAEQVMDGNDYTFNVKLDATPVAERLNVAFGSGTVKDAMKYYVITVPAATAERLNATTDAPVAFVQAKADEVSISDSSKLPAGQWYARIEITDEMKADNNGAVSYTWHNVLPSATERGSLMKWNADRSALVDADKKYTDEYQFTIYLVSEDSNIASWAQLNFRSATDGTSVVAPTTVFDVPAIRLQSATQEFSHEHKTNHTHPSGSRLTAFGENNTPDFDNPAVVAPVKYTRFNETAAPAKVYALPVTDEVTTKYGVNYRLYLMPEEVALAGNYNSRDYNVDLTGVDADARSAIEMTLYDVSLAAIEDNPEKTETAIDDYGSRIIADKDNLKFVNHILVEYTLGETTLVNADEAEQQNIEFQADFQNPDGTPRKSQYHNYLAEYYHNGADKDGNPDDWGEMKPGKGKLGYFAYATVEFDFDLGTDLEAYAAFHLPQKVMYNADHRGCYGQHNPGGNGGLERAWYMYSFAGTKAANGGHPMNFDEGDIRALDGFVAHSGSTPWTESWTESNDWSTLAVKGGRLPLQINPVFYHGDEIQNSISGTIEGNLAALYPVVKGNGLAAVVNTASPVMAKAAADRALDDLYLFQAKVPATIELQNAGLQTGVEEIMGDGDADAPAEYYNLQGIRIANPAKGQIYIMRQGATATKVIL